MKLFCLVNHNRSFFFCVVESKELMDRFVASAHETASGPKVLHRDAKSCREKSSPGAMKIRGAVSWTPAV